MKLAYKTLLFHKSDIFHFKRCFRKRKPFRTSSLYCYIPLLLFLLPVLYLFIPDYVFASLHSENPCFTSDPEKANIRYMIHIWDHLMSEYQLAHWLDYGSLLGSHRFADVIPWDHDGDVAFLWKDVGTYRHYVVGHLLNKFNITVVPENPVNMKYNGTTIDVFAMGTYEELKYSMS